MAPLSGLPTPSPNQFLAFFGTSPSLSVFGSTFFPPIYRYRHPFSPSLPPKFMAVRLLLPSHGYLLKLRGGRRIYLTLNYGLETCVTESGTLFTVLCHNNSSSLFSFFFPPNVQSIWLFRERERGGQVQWPVSLSFFPQPRSLGTPSFKQLHDRPPMSK